MPVCVSMTPVVARTSGGKVIPQNVLLKVTVFTPSSALQGSPPRDGVRFTKRKRAATAFQRPRASSAASSQHGPQLASGVAGHPSRRFNVAWASGQNTATPLMVVRTNAQVPVAQTRQKKRAKPHKSDARLSLPCPSCLVWAIGVPHFLGDEVF